MPSLMASEGLRSTVVHEFQHVFDQANSLRIANALPGIYLGKEGNRSVWEVRAYASEVRNAQALQVIPSALAFAERKFLDHSAIRNALQPGLAELVLGAAPLLGP